VRGRLSIEGDRLVFRHDPGQPAHELDVDFGDIGSVSSPPGAPVMEIELIGRELPEVLFYFYEPPFMFGRQSQFKLAAANVFLRDEVDAWVDALRRRKRGEVEGSVS
jgi:hypothetical protein